MMMKMMLNNNHLHVGCIIVAVMLILLINVVHGEEKTNKKLIMIIPGGGHSDHIDLDGEVCTISYTSLGPRPEGWIMEMKVTQNKVVCDISSSQPQTHQVFPFISTSLSGRILRDVDFWDNSGIALIDDQYVIDRNTDVRNAAGQTPQVRRITMVADRTEGNDRL